MVHRFKRSNRPVPPDSSGFTRSSNSFTLCPDNRAALMHKFTMRECTTLTMPLIHSSQRCHWCLVLRSFASTMHCSQPEFQHCYSEYPNPVSEALFNYQRLPNPAPIFSAWMVFLDRWCSVRWHWTDLPVRQNKGEALQAQCLIPTKQLPAALEVKPCEEEPCIDQDHLWQGGGTWVALWENSPLSAMMTQVQIGGYHMVHTSSPHAHTA